MGLFIFEGADNVGKTTLIKAVSAKLDCLVIKEPGGRDALLAEGFDPQKLGASYPSLREVCVNGDMPQNAKRAAFLADSIYQQEVITKPAIDSGITVLSDRSWVSDLAYGSVFTGISIPRLYLFNTLLRERLKAHVFYLYGRWSTAEVNGMDSLAMSKQEELDEAYRFSLNKYFRAEEVTFIDSKSKNVVERILKKIEDTNSFQNGTI